MSGSGGGSERSWVAKSRDGVLFVLGVVMIVFDCAEFALGHPFSVEIFAGACVLLGIPALIAGEAKK